MKIDKIKGTYNDYKVEVSFGQLQAIKSALERDHADPVSDELYAELCWYLDNIPGPGEEKDDLKARDEMGVDDITKDGNDDAENDDYPLPMPPGHADGGTDPAPTDAPEPESGIAPERDGNDEEIGSTPVPGEDLEDEGLPKPPAE